MMRRGSVLIYVVWVVILLSLLAAAAGSQASFALNLSDRLSGDLRAAYLARGAAAYAATVLARDRTLSADGSQDEWSDSPGLFLDHPLPGGSFSLIRAPRADGAPRYGMDDEGSRVSLNASPAEVLQRLFQAAGAVDEEAAAEIAAAVEDWRDEDDDERPKGAEGFYYRSRSKGYDCKNGPFENVEELLLIRGVTPELYRAVEPHLTVYGWGRVNLNTAGRVVLQALGLSQAGVAGLAAFRAGENGLEGDADDRWLVSPHELEAELKPFVPVEDLSVLARLVAEQAVATSSDAFRLSIDAQTDDGASRMRVLCVMNRDGAIALWREQAPTPR
jgi:general secretion pathway protein K